MLTDADVCYMTQEAARAYMKKLGIDERTILVLARQPSGYLHLPALLVQKYKY